jgi:hypothetical protein
MPNPINPNDYNIDKLNTGFLGPILTTDFRDYILGFNLENINPSVVSNGYNLGGLGDYVGSEFNPNPSVQDLPGANDSADLPFPILGNFTPWESNQIMNLWGMSEPYSYQLGNNTIQTSPPVQNKMAYTVDPSTTLSDPGNTSLWFKKNSGELEYVKDIREKKNLNENEYGPEFIYDYTDPDKLESTGYIQYKTFAGGDFRASILGQQLGFGAGAGIEYDSDLADIGKEQRKFNVKERIKLNFIGDTIGKINADPLGLLAGQDLFTRDYTITQAPGFGGKAAEFTKSLLGFNYPSSTIPSWKSVPGFGFDVNEDLLNNTGEGTKSLLYDSIVKNKWGPRFAKGGFKGEPDTKVGKFFKNLNDKLDTFGGAGEQPSTIKYTDQVTTDVKAQETREKSLVDRLNSKVAETVDSLVEKINPVTVPTELESPSASEDPTYGNPLGYNIDFQDTTHDDEYEIQDQFNSLPNSAKQYTNRFKSTQYTDKPELTSDKNNLFWEAGNQNRAKRGLLKYTQNLIDKNIDNSFSSARYIGIVNDDSNINPDADNKHKLFSQGNRVTIGEGDNKVYCRSWSVRNPYSTYKDTIRHEKLRRDEIFGNLSVLEDNGMPKIVPYPDDVDLSQTKDPSPYMLSIENLAWQNTREFNALPKCEKGPHSGRIMWFPPYDINFTDNSSVNWESTQFIGRGEPIYTYNNTERTGTLSFTIITDHPSSLNELRNKTQANLERYFAGCEDLTTTAFGDIDGEEIPEPEYAEDPVPLNPPTGPTPKLTFYFENASTTGEFDPGRNVYTDLKQGYESSGLNTSFTADTKAMVDFLLTDKGKRYKIVSEGFTSALNVSSYNEVLGKDRAKSLRTYLTEALIEAETGKPPVKYENFEEGNQKDYPKEISWKNNSLRWAEPVSRGEVENSGQNDPIQSNQTPADIEKIINDPVAKKARRATIRLEYDPKGIDAFMLEKTTNEVEDINKSKKAEYNRKLEEREKKVIDAASERLAKEMVNECTYFNKIKVENSFIYDSLKEKVQYFHPAFHSMTPEGLNSRLTFLKQCTRQGPNINAGEPQNMAFGKPPICVLRIGDFYHTKIVIDTVNLTYEPLIWDLNPEGIGVQPMITKVDLNFKFIGGSSLGGPITELQNAVSFNFFANTSVYNRRKNITVSSKDPLPGRKDKDGKPIKTETFGYGSFISPNQVEGNKRAEDIPEVKINLDLDTKQSNNTQVTDKGKTDPKLEETKKAIKDAEESGEDKFSKAADVVKFTNIGAQYGGGSITIVTKTLIEIIPEEKDNWEIVIFEFDTKTPGSEGDGISSFTDISDDGKSVTFTDYEGNIEASAGESGDYWYKLRVYVNNLQTGEQRIFTEEVTNTIP